MFLYSLIRVFQINLDNFLMIFEILLNFQGRYSDLNLRMLNKIAATNIHCLLSESPNYEW